MRLRNKVAVITGGSRGQGAAEARLFAKEGASVIIGDILDHEGEKVSSQIQKEGGSALYVRLDVQKSDDWYSAVRLAVKEYGKIDILVNNAAILTLSTIEETTKEEWDKVMDINMWGIMLGTKAVLPEMRKAGGGSIVNIASLSAITAQPWAAAYHASKGAVRIHTKEAALEFAKDNIRVNSINPGAIDTDMIRDAYGIERQSEYEDLIPLGRLGTPEDIARAVLFFASDDSSYITGSELNIDGGRFVKS
jgi:cyclopentanol dehydrogenase